MGKWALILLAAIPLSGCCGFDTCRTAGAYAGVAWDGLGKAPAAPVAAPAKYAGENYDGTRAPRTAARRHAAAAPFQSSRPGRALQDADLNASDPWVREQAKEKRESDRIAKVLEICRGCLQPADSSLANLRPVSPRAAVAAVR